MKHGLGVAAVLVLATAAWGGDPPAKPKRHENKVSPEAQAAMDRFRGLVYRPTSQGLDSAKGVIVPIGLQTHARSTFEVPPGSWLRTSAARELEAERRVLGLAGNFIDFPLSTAWYPSNVFGAEYDAEVAASDGGPLLRLAEYDEAVPTAKSEFQFDAAGLLVRQVWRALPGQDSEDYDFVATYTWTKLGELHAIDSFEMAYQDGSTRSYRCAYRYTDVGGVHLVTSYDMTFSAKDAPPRKFTFHVDDLVVNGKPVELSRPWRHVNKVSPEAKAAIEKHGRLVQRPADRGLRTLTASVLLDGDRPTRWQLGFWPPSSVDLTPAQGESPTAAQKFFGGVQIQMPLQFALASDSVFDAEECDAEFVEEDGRRVLVFTTFRDGVLTRTDRMTLGPAGLLETVWSGVEGKDAPKIVLKLAWQPREGRHRLSSLETTVGEGRRQFLLTTTLTWSEAAGIPLVTSMASRLVAKDGDKEVSVRTSTIRVTDLVVNDAKAEAVDPDAHRNVITPEARAALERFDQLVYHPRDNGLASATGTFAPIGLAFGVTRDGVGVTPTAAQPDERTRSIAVWFKLVLHFAIDGPPVAAVQEYDAAFVNRLGVPVLSVTVFKGDEALERRESTFDENGLVTSIRFFMLKGAQTQSECRFGWTRVGERWQVARAEMWDATMAMHVLVVYGWSEVAGVRLPLSIRCSIANLGAGFDGRGTEFTVTGLVLNGKSVETPKSPFHVNQVAPEALKLIADFERQVYRPAEHGLKSASGRTTDGSPQSCSFAFSAPRFLRTKLVPSSKPDATPARDQASRDQFALLLAFDSLRAVDALEFDARVLSEGGTRVVEVVEYLQGTRTATCRMTFDEGGLVSTFRRTDGAAESGGATDTCMRLTWQRTGDQARIVSCDLTTGSFDATVHTVFVIVYASVAGLDLPVTWSRAIFRPEGQIEATVRVEDLVVNGKPVAVPAPR